MPPYQDFGGLERTIVGAEDFDLVQHTITLRDPSGTLVTMDLGTGDVHIDAALSNYISGFRNAEFGADAVAPPVVVNKASDFYFEFNPDNAFAPVGGIEVAPGADVPEVNPLVTNDRFATKGYALASVLPTELIANQDAPLNLEMAATRMLMEKLLVSRELRVQAMATTSANFSSAQSLVTTIAAGSQWNGGANANPVRDIKNLMERSLMLPTDMGMSYNTWNAFCESPAVQKYVFAKSGVRPLPEKSRYDEWSALLELPRPNIFAARTKTAANTYPYIWQSHVTLFRRPPGDAVSMFDVSTFKTMRWNGAGQNALPTEFGGRVQGGFTVRSFFNPFKGKRGCRVIIVAHDDAEIVTGGTGQVSLVGGLLLNAFQ
jgi:hypothetical protein